MNLPPDLLNPSQMATVDLAAPSAGVASLTLMEHAGRAVARAIRARMRPCRTLVLCGPGNNGGDGYVVARLLAEQGWPVSVAALAAPNPGGDAAAMRGRWRGPMRPFAAEEAARAELVVDALFGAGLTRDLPEETAAVLKAARRIVAVDIPSGVDGATGAVRGWAPKAELTVTFVRRKPGHLLLPGRDLCGEVVLADIGMPAEALASVTADCFANGPALWRLPPILAETQKYARGTLTVLAGEKMAGAARLAALAARRAGTGLLTMAVEKNGDVLRGTEPGLIVTEQSLEELLQDQRRRTWLCGPGLGQDRAKACLPALIAAGRQIVADADALSAYAGDPDRLRGVAVITPHAGEFAKLFGPPREDRLTAARRAAARLDAIVVLKGADTIIASPDGRAAINGNAPSSLATAGSGDTLAGIIASFLAQGMPAFDAAAAGVWLHGAAAQHAGGPTGAGLIAEDLADGLVLALRAYREEEG